jgi:hypothetical protein
MDESDFIERTAVEMIKRFRSGAAQIARGLAEIAEEGHNGHTSAETWHDIANAIERLWPKAS